MVRCNPTVPPQELDATAQSPRRNHDERLLVPMLKLKLIVVGKLKERFWRDGCNEYLKRLGAHASVTVRELPDSSKDRESALLVDELRRDLGAHRILLDIHGKPLTSPAIAQRLSALALEGHSRIDFVIGGSEGVGDEVRHAVDECWSFGAITLPHNLARVVLLEQLYRAFRIMRGEPYHK